MTILRYPTLLLLAAGSLCADDVMDDIIQKESIISGERKARSENFFETGLLLYRQQQYEKAAEYFKSALQLNPSDEEAKQYLIRVQSVLGDGTGAMGVSQGDWVQQNLLVRRQEQWAKVELQLEEANTAYVTLSNRSDDSPAERLSSVLEVTSLYEATEGAVQTLDPGEEQRKVKMLIEDRLENLRASEIKLRSQVEASMRAKAQDRMKQERLDNEAYFDNKIDNILMAAMAEFDRENFESCVDLCEDILLVDSKNKKAQELKAKALRASHAKIAADNKFENKKELSRRLLKIKEQFVPYSSSVVYPSDWDAIDARNEVEFGEQEVEVWKKKLEGQMDRRLSYSCPGLPLTEVLSQLSELSGLNLVLSPKVLQERDEMDLEVNEFDFGHMKLKNIIQWICREVDLDYILKFDVIYITEKADAIEEMEIRLYDIQDLLSAKQNFVAPSLQDGFVGEEAGEIQIEADDFEAEEPLSGDVIVEMIQESIRGGNWDEGEGVLLQSLDTGALFVRNSPDVHLQIAEFLETFRKTSSLQIEVEARSLRIAKGFFRELGVDWKGLDSTSPLDVGTAAGYFNDSNESRVIKAAIDNGLASTIPGVGFFMEHSILGSFQAKVLVNAIERDTDTTQLIAPKLVLVNNVLGYIRLGRTQNYIATYENGEGDGANVGLQPTIATVDEGQLLAVTPTISSDRKYITLRLHPDFQEVDIPRSVAIRGTQTIASATGTTVAEYSLPVDLPTVRKKKVRTTAVIPDDGVLILGGVSSSSEEDSSRGVPLLSNIPILGRLFRSDNNEDSSADDMLLVHGKILVFDELEAGL